MSDTVHANALPMLIFMGVLASFFLSIFPLILRKRQERQKRELHNKIEDAVANIMEDGKVTIPKGKHVPHKSWNVGARAGHEPLTDGTTRPPSSGGYYGSG